MTRNGHDLPGFPPVKRTLDCARSGHDPASGRCRFNQLREITPRERKVLILVLRLRVCAFSFSPSQLCCLVLDLRSRWRSRRRCRCNLDGFCPRLLWLGQVRLGNLESFVISRRSSAAAYPSACTQVRVSCERPIFGIVRGWRRPGLDLVNRRGVLPGGSYGRSRELIAECQRCRFHARGEGWYLFMPSVTTDQRASNYCHTHRSGGPTQARPIQPLSGGEVPANFAPRSKPWRSERNDLPAITAFRKMSENSRPLTFIQGSFCERGQEADIRVRRVCLRCPQPPLHDLWNLFHVFHWLRLPGSSFGLRTPSVVRESALFTTPGAPRRPWLPHQHVPLLPFLRTLREAFLASGFPAL